MTPLTFHEHSLQVFGETIPKAQEGSISGNALQHLAFSDTIPLAQDGTFSAGQLSAGTYRESGGKATYVHNKYKVKPSMSDFVIDVHNVARKALTADEYKYFKQTYFTEFLGIAEVGNKGQIVSQDRTQDGRDKFFAEFLERFSPHDHQHVIAFDRSVRQKVGAALIENGLHPFRSYMNKEDIDVRKRFEQ